MSGGNSNSGAGGAGGMGGGGFGFASPYSTMQSGASSSYGMQPPTPSTNYGMPTQSAQGFHANDFQQTGQNLWTAQRPMGMGNQQPQPQQPMQAPPPPPQNDNPWALSDGDNFDFHHHYMPGDTATFHGQQYLAQGDPNIWNENSPPTITSNLWKLASPPPPPAAPAQLPQQQPQSNFQSAMFVGARPDDWQFTGKMAKGGIAALRRGSK